MRGIKFYLQFYLKELNRYSKIPSTFFFFFFLSSTQQKDIKRKNNTAKEKIKQSQRKDIQQNDQSNKPNNRYQKLIPNEKTLKERKVPLKERKHFKAHLRLFNTLGE